MNDISPPIGHPDTSTGHIGPRATLAHRMLGIMLRCRIFEEMAAEIRAKGEALGNVFPSLGQEAVGAIALALCPGDVVFPSYRSRPVFFGCGVTAEDHFREMLGAPGAPSSGREVFHHASWPDKGVMPGSSMIGAWAPMAAGYAQALRIERAPNIAVCVIGDGSFGAGDLHEALNIVGVWKLPFVLVAENNGYQVSANWAQMRRHKSLEPHLKPYGFVTRGVDGNDAFAVYQGMQWAREHAAAGVPSFLDCHTYRMGGYSSHLGEPRRGHEAELIEWQERDPIGSLRKRMEAEGILAVGAFSALEQEIRAETISSLGRVRAAIATRN